MSGTLSTIVIILILVVVLFFAVKYSIPHFKGEGGCCGGAEKEKLKRPKKLDNVVGTRIIKIEGMRCENCRRRVQNALNSIDGVSAKVNGDKAEAVVKLGRDIDNDELKNAVEALGYRATCMK